MDGEEVFTLVPPRERDSLDLTPPFPQEPAEALGARTRVAELAHVDHAVSAMGVQTALVSLRGEPPTTVVTGTVFDRP